jgi:hypothetical protein
MRVSVLQELRKDQYSDLRLCGTNLQRGAEPVIGAIRRHLDVGHYHIGTVGAHLADQLLGVPRGGNHVESAVLEDVNDAFSDDGLVLAHRHPGPSGRVHVATLCDR